MIEIVKDIYHGRPWTEMSKADRTFLHKVQFMGSVSKETSLLMLQCLILRSYGISPDNYSYYVQVFNIIKSVRSIVFAFRSVRKILLSISQDNLFLFY